MSNIELITYLNWVFVAVQLLPSIFEADAIIRVDNEVHQGVQETSQVDEGVDNDVSFKAGDGVGGSRVNIGFDSQMALVEQLHQSVDLVGSSCANPNDEEGQTCCRSSVVRRVQSRFSAKNT